MVNSISDCKVSNKTKNSVNFISYLYIAHFLNVKAQTLISVLIVCKDVVRSDCYFSISSALSTNLDLYPCLTNISCSLSSAIRHLTNGAWPVRDQLQQRHPHSLLHLPFSVWLPLWFPGPEVKLHINSYILSKYLIEFSFRLSPWCLLCVRHSSGPQRTAPVPLVPPAQTMRTSRWFPLWRLPT